MGISFTLLRFYFLELSSQPQVWASVADDRAVYFGSSDGYVYAVNTANGKLRWRSPTSAAVATSPVITGDRLLVASLDDFVYALSKKSGDRLWKRRMDSRIAASPIIEGDANMVAPLRATT